jgi:hypothetical protein
VPRLEERGVEDAVHLGDGLDRSFDDVSAAQG